MSSLSPVVEQNLVEAKSWEMEDAQRERWELGRGKHRFMAFKHKNMVIFEFKDTKTPVIKDTLTCVDVNLGFEGFSSTWESADGKVHTITHMPYEVAPGVFMWHTFGSDVQYVPYKQTYAVRFSMMLRSTHHPAQRQIGHAYIQEKANFELDFPA